MLMEFTCQKKDMIWVEKVEYMFKGLILFLTKNFHDNLIIILNNFLEIIH